MKYKSALMTSASGSLGGITASHNRGGQYFRARVEPTNPQTCPQSAARSAFAAASQAWTELTPAERAAWDTYAANTPHTPAFCGPMFLTGQQQFVATNSLAIRTSFGIITAAPTTYDHGNQQSPPDEFLIYGDPPTLETTVAIPDGASAIGAAMLFVGPPANSRRPVYQFTLAGSTNFMADDDEVNISIAGFQTTPPSSFIPWDYTNGYPFATRTVLLYDDGRHTYPTTQVVTEGTTP